MNRKQLCALIALALGASVASNPALADPQTYAFSYQGQLTSSSGLVNNNSQTFTFTLYNVDSGGSPISGPGITNPLVVNNVLVADGLFSVDLNFGLVFDGSQQYWLEVTVGNGTGAQTLSPRQPVNTVPVAQFAFNTPAGSGGATGPTGPTGPTGATGTNGTDGTNGATGAAGPAGPTGATGANGTDGTNGTNGTDGATGATGSAGATGATGAEFAGPWGSGDTYGIGGIVTYNGSSYINTTGNNTGD
ncbi:MAG: hypothetical protein ACREPN_05195, partial [Rudaea sp.]